MYQEANESIVRNSIEPVRPAHHPAPESKTRIGRIVSTGGRPVGCRIEPENLIGVERAVSPYWGGLEEP